MVNNNIVRLISPRNVTKTDGTWSQGVRKNNFIFISGQVPLDFEGNIIGKSNFELQAKQALDNFMSVLDELGGKQENIMMITVFLTNMKYRPLFAKIRENYFKKNPPASTVVEVTRLFMEEILIEINGIAFL